MLNLRRFSLAAFTLLLGACSDPTPPAPPQQQVLLADVVEKEYKPAFSFVGQIQAIQDIDVLPKVSGYLEEISFKEGQKVKVGDSLFRIDDKPFEAALSQANADLASAQASLEVANNSFNRGKELVEQNYISQAEMDELRGRFLAAESSVKGAEATVENAQLNLGYTHITAAFDGVVDEAKYAVGDLVSSAGHAMTRLTSVDPIHATFTVTDKVYVSSRREVQKRTGNGQTPADFEAWVKLANGERYEHPGKIDFISNLVNTDTGTVTVRSTMPNPDGFLKPGMHVSVELEFADPSQGVFVPRVAVQVDQQGDYVYTVDDKNIAQKVYVELGHQFEGDTVLVDKGLEQGQRVVTKGLQRLRSGQEVQVAEPKPYEESTEEKANEKADDKGA